ncbi:MAG: DUF2244 domain-containing protein [Gammaproteobacteria bacterium]|nr:DUF2244 domain-containing protein [Gammaproteobacteria bacterium]
MPSTSAELRHTLMQIHQTSISIVSDIRNEPQVWVITPTRALSWTEAKRVLWLVSAFPAASGLLFLYLGAPLVLPFAGLEIVLLWVAFYYVIRGGQWREVIRLTESKITLEKGRNNPSEIYSFDRAWVQVHLRQSTRQWQPSQLTLTSKGREVTLGEFLTDCERSELAQSLFNAIHKTR